MSQPVLVKAYGNLSPAEGGLAAALQESCSLAMPPDPGNPPLSLKGELLLLSFEGIYFPIDDFIQLLQERLNPQISGKVDYLDLENWQMTRYLVGGGEISGKTVPLNHVLDYSGF